MAAGTIALLITSTGLVAYPLVMKLTASAEATELVKPIAEEAARAAAGILADQNMRYWCLVGAFCGAWMSVFAFRPKTAMEILGKWITSFFAAICFMPPVIEYMGFADSTSWVTGITAAGALVGWSLIQIVQPLLISIASSAIAKKIKIFFNMTDEEDQPAPRRRRR